MFADHRERNDSGQLLYPRDVELRRRLGFIEEVFKHPAKANLHVLQDLIEYCTQPGERIMDITAGTGSILLACTMGRKVTCIDLNPMYIDWMRRSAQQMRLEPGSYAVLEGDCRELLPLPCDAILFSPPYANVLHAGGGILDREAIGQQLKEYSGTAKVLYNPDEYVGQNSKNLGVLPEFRFNIAMKQIYQKCLDSVRPGGFLALLIKDAMRQQKVTPLGWHHVQMLGKAGWEMDSWVQWDAPGMQFKDIHRAQGHKVVEGEHIIVMRRPQ